MKRGCEFLWEFIWTFRWGLIEWRVKWIDLRGSRTIQCIYCEVIHVYQTRRWPHSVQSSMAHSALTNVHSMLAGWVTVCIMHRLPVWHISYGKTIPSSFNVLGDLNYLRRYVQYIPTLLTLPIMIQNNSKPRLLPFAADPHSQYAIQGFRFIPQNCPLPPTLHKSSASQPNHLLPSR